MIITAHSLWSWSCAIPLSVSGGADITLRAYGEAISHKLYTHVKMSIIGVPVPQSIQCGNKKVGKREKHTIMCQPVPSLLSLLVMESR